MIKNPLRRYSIISVASIELDLSETDNKIFWWGRSIMYSVTSLHNNSNPSVELLSMCRPFPHPAGIIETGSWHLVVVTLIQLWCVPSLVGASCAFASHVPSQKKETPRMTAVKHGHWWTNNPFPLKRKPILKSSWTRRQAPKAESRALHDNYAQWKLDRNLQINAMYSNQ